MRIKMKDTTRHQHYNQMLAGDVYEVDDATGEHLLQMGIAQKTSAKATADQEAEDAAMNEEPPAERAGPRMVTREDARGLTGEQPAPAPTEESPAGPRRGTRS